MVLLVKILSVYLSYVCTHILVLSCRRMTFSLGSMKECSVMMQRADMWLKENRDIFEPTVVDGPRNRRPNTLYADYC